MSKDTMGNIIAARRCRLMLINYKFQSNNRAFRGIDYSGSASSVDKVSGWQKQKLTDFWFSPRGFCSQQLTKQSRNLWPDAGQGADRSEKRVKQRWTHDQSINRFVGICKPDK